MNESPLIHVVDNDAANIDSLAAHLRSLRLECRVHVSAEALLVACVDRPGCIIAGDALADMRGLDLQLELQRREILLPLILMTATPQTELIVTAMRNGAIAVLDKPCTGEALWKAVEAALALDADRRYRRGRHASMQERIGSLTPQEREVMWQIVDGSPNKITARRLGVSVRTIENRRRSIFAKLGIRSVAELVTIVMQTTTDEQRPPLNEAISMGELMPQSLLCTAG
ncbi:response regulator transcription factor [Lacipirellula sp.]|uniref:response regulator transcription factor n=1 Tax=Lacipirellula sp. TaxID=2691419 RepID=UPI003D115883